MKKLITTVILALIVVLNFTATPANAATTAMQATTEALGAVIVMLPSEDRDLAMSAFDLGVASAEVISGPEDEDTCRRAFRQVMERMKVTEEQQEMAEKFFELGLVVGLAESEEAVDKSEEESDIYEFEIDKS